MTLNGFTNLCITDFFEVSVLLGSCFIVNYVTADAKTNWAEGYAMVSFYFMIVSATLLDIAVMLTFGCFRHFVHGSIPVNQRLELC